MYSYGRLVAVLGAVLLATSALAAEPMPKLPDENPVGVIDDTGGGLGKIEEQNGISYISGGAGSDEAKAFNSVRDGFNLKLTTSVSSGAYTSPRLNKTEGSTASGPLPSGNDIAASKRPAARTPSPYTALLTGLHGKK